MRKKAENQMDDFHPNNEFYCIKLKEHVTALNCKNGLAAKGPPACIDCVKGREKVAEILDFNKNQHKKKKAVKQPERKETKGDTANTSDSIPITKRCCRCKEYKPLSEFHKNKRTPDGLQWHCRDCSKDYEEEKKRKNFRRKVLENEKNIEKAMVVVDFIGHKELLNKLVTSARKNYRLLENEILWLINKGIGQE